MPASCVCGGRLTTERVREWSESDAREIEFTLTTCDECPYEEIAP